MLRFMKSLSRTVHDQRCQDQEQSDDVVGIHGGNDGGGGPMSLTVWRKSLFVGCSGFTVINSGGDLVYRVDNYGGRRRQELVLMDASGKAIFTISCCKKLKLVDSWLVFEGEISSKKQQPLYRVSKYINILPLKIKKLARVNRSTNYDENEGYIIEGSYMNRSCKVLDESRNVVAEIRRKENVTQGVIWDRRFRLGCKSRD